MELAEVKKRLRQERLPHIWCAGCGDGTLVACVIRALEGMGKDPNKVTVITGVGCSARFNTIMDYHTFATLHGRALPFATGYKMSQPDMDVIVVMGDGDCIGIGGNHFIHACRRNINVTALVINNNIYGMTGGQYSPLTPYHSRASTAVETFEHPFDLCELAMAAGATYVGRSTVFHTRLTESLMQEAIEHKGFSLIEVISQCPTNFGKKNKLGSAYDMLMEQKSNAVMVDKAKEMTAEQLDGKHVIGNLLNRNDRNDFHANYTHMCRLAQGRTN